MVALAIAGLPAAHNIGMLASPAVRKVGLYAKRLEDTGFTARFPDSNGETRLLDVIRAVKAARVTTQVRREYAEIAAGIAADAYLIACTELSVLGAPDGIEAPVVDSLDALVRGTIAEAKST